MNLLPEYHALPYGSRFKAAFKLFEGTDWHMVPNLEPFASKAEAIEAAKAHVKVALNPKMRSSKMEAELSDVLGVDEWFRQKRESLVSAESVFGDCPPSVKDSDGREVVVEKRKKR